MAYEYKQNFFKPRNPQKYVGDPTQIFYRSWWEFTIMSQLDSDPNVVQWQSEEIAIPYVSPKDNRIHRYFPDFRVKYKDGSIQLIEVKPHAQTRPPVKGKKKQSTYLNEVMTYAINTRKWEAARAACNKYGWKFIILTEKEVKSWAQKK